MVSTVADAMGIHKSALRGLKPTATVSQPRCGERVRTFVFVFRGLSHESHEWAYSVVADATGILGFVIRGLKPTATVSLPRCGGSKLCEMRHSKKFVRKEHLVDCRGRVATN